MAGAGSVYGGGRSCSAGRCRSPLLKSKIGAGFTVTARAAQPSGTAVCSEPQFTAECFGSTAVNCTANWPWLLQQAEIGEQLTAVHCGSQSR